MDVQLDESRKTVTIGSDALSLDPFENNPGLPRTVSIRTGGSHDVTLTLPGGRRTTFLFKPKFHWADMYAEATWEAPPGVTETLKPLDSGLIDLPYGIPPLWHDGGFHSTFHNHDINGWVLESLDGTQFYITRGEGETIYWDNSGDGSGTYIPVTAYDAQPKLTAILQRSRDLIKISDSGIEHYANGTNLTRSVFIERDTAGRIIAIRYPNSGNN